MSKYRITQFAEVDLCNIWLQISQERPLAGDRMLDRLERRIKLLTDNSELGELRPDLAPDVRHSIVAPYVIL